MREEIVGSARLAALLGTALQQAKAEVQATARPLLSDRRVAPYEAPTEYARAVLLEAQEEARRYRKELVDARRAQSAAEAKSARLLASRRGWTSCVECGGALDASALKCAKCTRPTSTGLPEDTAAAPGESGDEDLAGLDEGQ